MRGITRNVAKKLIQIHVNFFLSWDKKYFMSPTRSCPFMTSSAAIGRQPIDIVGAYLRQCLKQHAT